MARPPKKSKRFKYNLQTVLKYRGIKEDQEREKFNQAEIKHKKEKEKEDQLKATQKQEYSDLKEKMGKGQMIDFLQVNMRKSHLEVLKQQVEDQEKVTESAQKEKEQQREALIKASKDKKILEKDKEKKRLAWKKLMEKEDGKFLDEIATIGFTRSKNETLNEQKT